MHPRRHASTAMFLAVVLVTFIVSTITSTATSHPLEPTPSTVSAIPTPPTSEATPTTAPATVPEPTPVTTPTPTTALPPSPSTTATPAEAFPADDETPTDLLTTAREALDSVVPPGWFGSQDLQWGLLDGSSTVSTNNPPTIEVGRDHFEDPAKLRFILAHEWGHHVAFRYGNPDALPGEPPVGFDAGGNDPAEMWAGCIAEVLVPDYWISTHGLPHCATAAKEFTANFLAAGPY